MRRRIGEHVRSQMVGYLALFVALGGTAVAAGLPANSVGTEQIKNHAVTGPKVALRTLTGANINLSKLGTVPNAAGLGGLSPSKWQRLVTGGCAANSAIAKIQANGSVACQPTGSGTITGVSAGTGLTGGGSSGDVSLSVANSGIGTSQLADSSVTNNKLANAALTITAGTGLSGGGSTPLGGSASLGVDPSAVQTRVGGTCGSGSAISSINQNGSVGCQSTGTPTILMGASGGNLTNNSFLAPDGSGQNTTEADVQGTSPTSGTLTELHVELTNAPGIGNAWTLRLRVNGVNTLLGCSIAGANTTCSDSADAVTVLPFDRLSLQVTASGAPSPTSASFGLLLG